MNGLVTRLALGLALLGVLGFGGTLERRWQMQREMVQAEQMDITESAPASLLFAKAAAFAEQNEWQEALRWYRLIDLNREPRLAQAVRYNMATLYLQAAARLWHDQGLVAYAELAALLGQAEEGYKQVLREDPGHWDARYNLEFALRIHPPDKEKKKADWHGTKSSVFATLPGLPGGGP